MLISVIENVDCLENYDNSSAYSKEIISLAKNCYNFHNILGNLYFYRKLNIRIIMHFLLNNYKKNSCLIT